jgi:hypothetical protein
VCAFRLKRNALGPDSPDLIATLFNHAVVAKLAGADADAATSGSEALRIARLAMTPSHPLRRAVERTFAAGG